MSTIGDDFVIELPGGGLTDSEGHYKLHPLSPIVHALGVFPAVIGIALAIFSQSISGLADFFPSLTPVLLAVLVVGLAGLVLTVIIAVIQYLRWRAFSFWLDSDGDLRVRSGVLFRNERRVQLSRMQAVDVVQPLAARLFSMATLVVEVAGQDNSRVSLKFLTLNHAREIRETLLSRTTKTENISDIESPVLFRLASRDLALSLFLRTSTVALFIGTTMILVVSYWFEGWAGIVFALFTGGLPILIIAAEFINFYGFTITDAPEGLRLRYGLIKTEIRTVPAGRVQAIDYVEPLLWRRKNWTRVKINIAGVGTQSQGSSGQSKETLLAPVAERALAEAIVSKVLPESDISTITWHHAPARAAKRSPIQWRNLAMGWTVTAFAARRGRVTRHTMVIPHARTQSVHVTQGPWERVLDLASLHVDTTPGPVTVSALHLDREEIEFALFQQVERSGGTPRRT